MKMLGQRAAIMSGEVDHRTLSAGNTLMATLSEHMHSALPEQRAIASELVRQAISDIAAFEQRHVGEKHGSHGYKSKH